MFFNLFKRTKNTKNNDTLPNNRVRVTVTRTYGIIVNEEDLVRSQGYKDALHNTRKLKKLMDELKANKAKRTQ